MPHNASQPTDPMTKLRWPLRWTRIGMAAERGMRAFWPAATILMAAFAALAFRIADMLPGRVLLGAGILVLLALIWCLYRGVARFSWPSLMDAEARLDATMSGRPIATLKDHPAVGQDDPASQAVWRAHLAQMTARLRGARAPSPDLRVAAMDRFGLRLMAGTALVMALLFGAIGRVADVNPIATPVAASAIAPSWEGWIEPPLYTGKPSLYLNDITRDEFEVPVGSRVTIRFYGSAGELGLRQTVTELPFAEGYDATAPAQDFFLHQSGEIAVDGPGGRVWTISALPDQPPAIVADGPLIGVPPNQFQLSFTATDDYGVVAGRAIIQLDPEAADRRFGLRIDPDPHPPLILDLPMPFTGSRIEFTELLLEDISRHPFANLPVTVSLEATDHAGQIGSSTDSFSRLPGRRFFDPLANALIEMRRDLLWSRGNRDRVSDILRALTWRPETLWDNEEAYRLTRRVITLLEAGDGLSEATRDEVADILWDVALMLEEGDLAGAFDRLQRAQERLEEAMRQGASDEEIAQLMQELREAMNDYMRELAENAEAPPTDQPDQSGETTEMSMADIEEMMRRIEELIQEGRMAEAMELMEQLRQMMENMQVTQGEPGDGPPTPGQEAMEGLQDTLRGQQDLSDDSFRQLQEQFEQGEQGNGGQGETGSDQTGEQGTEPGPLEGQSLAERQQELLRQLQEQAQNLPGLGSESAEDADQLLDDAARAMDDAAEALGEGDLAEALDSQSQAMEALREGMGQLRDALAEAQGLQEEAQGQAEAEGAPPGPTRDPLGRDAGSNGSFGTEESLEQREEASRRARDLLDELRRRSAEQSRPEAELDYLRRLLDQF